MAAIIPFIMVGVFVAYAASGITRDYLRLTGQLVSEQSCWKLEHPLPSNPPTAIVKLELPNDFVR